MELKLCCKDMGQSLTEGNIAIIASMVYNPDPEKRKQINEIWLKGNERKIGYCPYCGKMVIIKIEK